MAVVAAGMHHALIFAREGKTRFFRHGKRVNVASQHDGLPGELAFNAREGASAHAANSPGNSSLIELLADALGGLHLLRAFLGVLVEIAAHLNLISAVLFNKVLQSHF